ncbi:OmpP1/FadL family transporter [Vibrio breoganii]|uniref:OmpP1/FadL family transporter n=1 Tax=Vibrio breoganii TaxID=553239 RepID=UPI000C82A431|nr:outer membrane protein transport protein [Vibrio breoganii]PMK20710.1 hypothetical protein BCU06_06230 [Vibrio breoganii]PMK77701.1 hypothetical protein BCT94_05810 [Vibrio breoganii]PML64185.1 hypothetical protein BCT73_18115 [Vibrio breoganii]PMM88435.1 hypothetical protein BCT45_18475 [Vibrio breoganii]PMO83041.1 hypothetical protein BCT00_06490 [Vibrio breoganii]
MSFARSRCNHISIAIGISVASSTASASGIFLAEASYANMGTGSAGDGVYTGNAAAIWTNPATLSFMDEERHTINATVLNLDMEYTDANGGVGADSNKTMPLISYFSNHHINDKWAFGIAFSSRGGAALDYGYEWEGANQLTDVALVTYQFNPSVAYRIDDNVAFAAGLQVDYALINANTNNIELETEDSLAFGYNLGLMFDVSEQTKVGISYRSQLEHEFSGTSNLYTDNDQLLASGRYGAPLVTPAMVDISASYKINSNVTLMTSIQWHDWSKWQKTLVELDYPNSDLPYLINREFEDVWHFGFGGEYKLRNNWALKAGYSYETSPLDDKANQSPDLPVGEQHRYSLGVSKTWDKNTLDIYYEFADFGDMDIAQSGLVKDLNGHFTGKVHFVGLGYTF